VGYVLAARFHGGILLIVANPQDPIFQSIDADLTEGMADPSRANAIMRMLPRLLGGAPQVEPQSGLPQSGADVLADAPAIMDPRASMTDIYSNRAGQRQQGDIAEQELIGRRADRTLKLLDLLSKHGPEAKNPFGSVDPTKFTPESIAAFQRSGNYSRLVPKESGEGAMQPLPGVPGVFFRKGVTGQPEMVNAAGQPLTTEQVQQMEIEAKRAGATVVQMGFGAPVPMQGPGGENVLVMPPTRPGGKAEVVTVPGMGPLSPAAKPKEPTDVEKSASGYADRMIAAESIVERVGEAGLPTYATQAAGAIPGFGRYAQSEAMSPQQQMFRQAQEDWVRAKLRKESGAVIAVDEMRDEIRTYFPAPGDKPETIAQKANARRIATEAMLQQGGRARKLPRPTIPGQPAVETNQDVIDFNSLQ